jgi:hypothetical protein
MINFDDLVRQQAFAAAIEALVLQLINERAIATPDAAGYLDRFFAAARHQLDTMDFSLPPAEMQPPQLQHAQRVLDEGSAWLHRLRQEM